jgi:hypothetical protein
MTEEENIAFYNLLTQQIADLKNSVITLEDALDMDNMIMLCNIQKFKKQLDKFNNQLNTEIN